MQKFWLTTILVCFSFMQLSCSEFEGGTSKSMQEDFDKIRLDHVLIISNLVNEYKENNGHYPFANLSELPVYVTIASDEQIKNNKGKSRIFIDLNTRITDGNTPKKPKSIKKISFQEFKTELESGLQRTITVPIDPQKVPVNKPSIYIYTYYLDVFDVTAFLHNKFTFTRNLNQFNNKITIGNRSHSASAIWTPQDLMKQEEFRHFFQSAFNKGGYSIQTTLN